MNKRDFLKVTGIVGAGIAIAPFTACNTPENKDQSGGSTPEEEPKQASTSAFILPAKPIARSSPSQFGHLVGENRTNPFEPVFTVNEAIMTSTWFYFAVGSSVVHIYISIWLGDVV